MLGHLSGPSGREDSGCGRCNCVGRGSTGGGRHLAGGDGRGRARPWPAGTVGASPRWKPPAPRARTAGLRGSPASPEEPHGSPCRRRAPVQGFTGQSRRPVPAAASLPPLLPPLDFKTSFYKNDCCLPFFFFNLGRFSVCLFFPFLSKSLSWLCPHPSLSVPRSGHRYTLAETDAHDTQTAP